MWDYQILAKNSDGTNMVCSILVNADTQDEAVYFGENAIRAMLRDGLEYEPWLMTEVEDERSESPL